MAEISVPLDLAKRVHDALAELAEWDQDVALATEWGDSIGAAGLAQFVEVGSFCTTHECVDPGRSTLEGDCRRADQATACRWEPFYMKGRLMAGNQTLWRVACKGGSVAPGMSHMTDPRHAMGWAGHHDTKGCGPHVIQRSDDGETWVDAEQCVAWTGKLPDQHVRCVLPEGHGDDDHEWEA